MAARNRSAGKKRAPPAPARDAPPDEARREVAGLLPGIINNLTRQLNQVTLEDLKRFGMTVPRWSVLAVLARRDGRSIGELARATVIQQSSLTRVVDQMERDGLVERRPARPDSRYVEVWLTEQGRATYDDAVPLAVRRAQQALQGFRESELEQLTSLLQRLFENVRRDGK